MAPTLRATTLALCTLAILSSGEVARADDYDPLRVDPGRSARMAEAIVVDEQRTREIPIRVYLPRSPSGNGRQLPVVLFSHGLGGSRENNRYLAEHWAARGYAAVFLQHPGSDESVWKGVPPMRVMASLREAANVQSFQNRVTDVTVVLDQLATWNEGEDRNDEMTRRLGSRLDLQRIGMSGHSFGAVTTQAVAGQNYLGRQSFLDSRIRAAAMMSPSTPRLGDPKKAFADVSLPWLLLTGTHDDGKIGDQTPESRQQVYPALPPGDKYQLVLDGAEHSAFSDRALPGDRRRRNPNHHRAVQAMTTAFWDAYLQGDEAAKSWLKSDAVRSVLEPDDHWQHK